MNMVPMEELFPWLIPYRPILLVVGVAMFSIIAIGGITLWVFEQYEKWENYKVLKEIKSYSIWDSNIWYDYGMSSELK